MNINDSKYHMLIQIKNIHKFYFGVLRIGEMERTIDLKKDTKVAQLDGV